jgi:cytochrome oxidase Cu insertion factor (SCO1/SenC/PrrC family)
MRRAPLALALVAALAASACGGGGGHEHEHGTAASVTVSGGSGRFAGGELSPPKPVPDFTLTDQSGQQVSMADQRGKLVLLTFLYTNCPDVCPLITQNLNQALQMLGPQRDDVRVLAVSVDPEGDTPKAVDSYAKAHHLLPEFHYLIAGRADEGLEGLRRRGGRERSGARGPHRVHDAGRPVRRGPRDLRLAGEGQGRRPRRQRASELLAAHDFASFQSSPTPTSTASGGSSG